MFCPNCGTENQQDAVYCRSCGDDLKIISQAMKKHFPITLISRLDAVIEQKNERLRRDAVYNALMGIVFVILAVSLNSLVPLVYFGFFALGMILYGFWSYLAYRRSQELKTNSSKFFFNNVLPPSEISQAEGLPVGSDLNTKKLAAVSDFQNRIIPNYCPGCGTQIPETFPFCHACGSTLNFSLRPEGLERYLPEFLLKRLDTRIAKNEKAQPRYKNGWWFILISFTQIFAAIMQGLDGGWGWMIFLLFLGLSTLMIGGWDFISYRRSLEHFPNTASPTGNSLLISLPTAKTKVDLDAETQRPLTQINAEDESSLLCEAETRRELPELENIEPPTEPLSKSPGPSKNK